MDYDDPRWEGLQGGYRVFYDPCNALRSLENNKNVDEAWSELWNELHHQGTLGPLPMPRYRNLSGSTRCAVFPIGIRIVLSQ